jgi:hypothetical protein
MSISKDLVDEIFRQFGQEDINKLSIREMGKLVAQIEQKTNVEFIHMEMGVAVLLLCNNCRCRKGSFGQGIGCSFIPILKESFCEKRNRTFCKIIHGH